MKWDGTNLYRATYGMRMGPDRHITYAAHSDREAVEVARLWQLEDKLNQVESLRTKQKLLLEV